MKKYFALFLLLLFAICLPAQDHKPTTPEIKIIHAGHMLDVKTGRTLNNVWVVIEDGKIIRVGTDAEQGANIIELPNATLLPGLIDAHTHITFDPNFGYQELGISVPKEALIGAKNARITLEAGFTTVRNVGARAYTDVALRDAINEGMLPGPRMIVSGPALSITGGHCDNNLLPYEYHAQSDGAADGVEGVQHKVREIIKYGADVIKVCATGGVLSSKAIDHKLSSSRLRKRRPFLPTATGWAGKVAALAPAGKESFWPLRLE